MKVWLRRLLLLLFVLFWLALILMPTVAFILARNGQIQIGRSTATTARWSVEQEPAMEGWAVERGGAVPPPGDAPETTSCLQTRIAYWMWAGDGPPAMYCQCQDQSTGEALAMTPPACLLPTGGGND